MSVDINTLQDWYKSPLGKAVAKVLASAVKVNDEAQAAVLAVGFSAPFVKVKKAVEIRAFPKTMGRPEGKLEKKNDCTVQPQHMPFEDNQFDVLVVSHALEFAHDAGDVLAECFRVLRPEGKLMCVVPNRNGLWCQREISPFAWGQPFSKGQLQRLLAHNQFCEINCRGALYAPPIAWEPMIPFMPEAERFGRALYLPMGGVVVAEAVKRVTTGTLLPIEKVKVRPVIVGMPEPTQLRKTD